MVSQSEWQALDRLIDTHQKFFLATHMNPDGDALGATLGFYYYLLDKGKSVTVCCPTPTPWIYRFLDPDNTRITVFKQEHHPLILEAEVIVILDVCMFDRLGDMDPWVRQSTAVKVVIDHHTMEAPPPVDMILQDVSASSAGEMVYQYVRERGRISLPMAEALYVAVLTDTGSFRFTSSTPSSHLMAADLISLGVDPRKTYGHIYESGTLSRLRLLSRALTNIQTGADGKLVYTSITRRMMFQCKALREEIEGFVEFILALKGVEVSLLFVESPPKNIKVSLRSKGSYNINQVARKFGGGGHVLASGILMRDIEMKTAMEQVVAEAEHMIAQGPLTEPVTARMD